MNKCVAMLVLVVLPPLAMGVSAQPSPQPVADCTYLLAVLEKAVSYAVRGLPEGEQIAYAMLKTPVAPALSDLHTRSYRVLLSYYTTVGQGVGNSSAVQKLYELHQGVGVVSEYIKKLHSCCKDPEVAYVIRARAELHLRELRDRLEDMVKQYSTGYQHVVVRIDDRVYEPGEAIAIRVEVVNETCAPRSAALTYAGAVLDSGEFRCTGLECVAVLRAPPAYAVKDYVKSGVEKMSLVIRVSCSGRDFRVYRFASVKYTYPRVVMECSSTVTRGDVLNITLYSESGVLSGVLVVENATSVNAVANITISSTPTIFMLLVEKLYFSAGLNTLRLCVNATEKTLPHCFEKPIVVKPRHPSVEVKALPLYISWDGGAQLLIINHVDRVLSARVYVNGRLAALAELSPLNTTLLHVYRGLLPLSLASIVVDVEDPLMVYDTYSYTCSPTVVNLALTTAVVIGGLATTILLQGREKMFTLLLAMSGAPKGARGVAESIPDVLRNLLKPYVLGLGSRVAQLYYRLVNRFTRLPSSSETLREHYSTAVLSAIKSAWNRKVLWQFLLLAEKDMYSHEKPRPEEAKRLYESVAKEEH
uniref:Uncharacterized protein n=1 Tax=Ignisphaera aggregans TaxID=334771 RepID=A0A7C4FHP6_9CREN